MFSGIVETTARVINIIKEQENVHFVLQCPFGNELTIDQSVAHNGVCLTVVALGTAEGNVVTFGDQQISIVCATSLGKAEDSCMVEGSGGDLEIGFNNRYLLDALKAAPADEVNVCLNTGSSPCVITPAEGEDNFLYMILPVRLKAE